MRTLKKVFFFTAASYFVLFFVSANAETVVRLQSRAEARRIGEDFGGLIQLLHVN